MRREYFVYILASPSRTLYIGVTNNLERRMYEHKHKLFPRFTAKYDINRLMHIETFAHINDAIAREKELKAWRRAKKIALIEAENPRWFDLSADWRRVPWRVQRRPALRRRGIPRCASD